MWYNQILLLKEARQMTNERITKLSVKSLFNQFSYDVDFKSENNISILIGPNGTGKTTIMDFIGFVMNPTASTLQKLLQIPFETFSFEMTDGWTIKYAKVKARNAKFFPANIVLEITHNGNTSAIDFEQLAESNKQEVYIIRSDENESFLRLPPFLSRSLESRVESLKKQCDTINFEYLQELIGEQIESITDGFLPDDSFQFVKANRFVNKNIAFHDFFSNL